MPNFQLVLCLGFMLFHQKIMQPYSLCVFSFTYLRRINYYYAAWPWKRQHFVEVLLTSRQRWQKWGKISNREIDWNARIEYPMILSNKIEVSRCIFKMLRYIHEFFFYLLCLTLKVDSMVFLVKLRTSMRINKFENQYNFYIQQKGRNSRNIIRT